MKIHRKLATYKNRNLWMIAKECVKLSVARSLMQFNDTDKFASYWLNSIVKME